MLSRTAYWRRLRRAAGRLAGGASGGDAGIRVDEQPAAPARSGHAYLTDLAGLAGGHVHHLDGLVGASSKELAPILAACRRRVPPRAPRTRPGQKPTAGRLRCRRTRPGWPPRTAAHAQQSAGWSKLTMCRRATSCVLTCHSFTCRAFVCVRIRALAVPFSPVRYPLSSRTGTVSSLSLSRVQNGLGSSVSTDGAPSLCMLPSLRLSLCACALCVVLCVLLSLSLCSVLCSVLSLFVSLCASISLSVPL